MAIVNALAGIMVSDLTTAEAWYEQLLSRPADARPMEGLAEWKLADGGWIQVFQDKDRAGSSSVTFLVSGLDASDSRQSWRRWANSLEGVAEDP